MPSPAPARNLPVRPSRTTRPSRVKRNLLAVASLGLAGLVAGLLSGCGSGVLPTASANSYAPASGNWQFTSAAGTAARLSSLGGNLTVSADGSTVTGLLHPLSTAGQCVSPSTAIALSGSIGAADHLTLSAPLAGGTLSLSGTLAADRKSLSAATYAVTGGACAFASPQTSSLALLAHDTGTPVTAQQYQPVNGTYSGTLTTTDGEHFNLTTTLTQTSQPDSNGVYHVSGTATSPGNSCVPASLPATASTIDGGSIATTYTDAITGATIIGTGNSSPDAATITISHWNITGVCGTDSGTGVLTR